MVNFGCSLSLYFALQIQSTSSHIGPRFDQVCCLEHKGMICPYLKGAGMHDGSCCHPESFEGTLVGDGWNSRSENRASLKMSYNGVYLESMHLYGRQIWRFRFVELSLSCSSWMIPTLLNNNHRGFHSHASTVPEESLHESSLISTARSWSWTVRYVNVRFSMKIWVTMEGIVKSTYQCKSISIRNWSPHFARNAWMRETSNSSTRIVGGVVS